MDREELQLKSRFVIVGLLMLLISLVFLFYMGKSLVAATKDYKEQIIEMTLTNK